MLKRCANQCSSDRMLNNLRFEAIVGTVCFRAEMSMIHRKTVRFKHAVWRCGIFSINVFLFGWSAVLKATKKKLRQQFWLADYGRLLKLFWTHISLSPACHTMQNTVSVIIKSIVKDTVFDLGTDYEAFDVSSIHAALSIYKIYSKHSPREPLKSCRCAVITSKVAARSALLDFSGIFPDTFLG